MNTEAQKTAIAIACGWKYTDNDPDQYPYWLAPKGDWRYENPLDANLFPKAFPNYLNDLNAMNEVEKTLSKEQWLVWLDKMATILKLRADVPWDYKDAIAVARSTAAQRAEAFLRTIGKWEGAK